MKATGERWERRLWRPRCSALPVAETAEHKRVQGSVADAAGLSARKIPGTPNGKSDLSEWPRSTDEEGFSKPTKMSGTATGIVQPVDARVIITQKCDRAL